MPTLEPGPFTVVVFGLVVVMAILAGVEAVRRSERPLWSWLAVPLWAGLGLGLAARLEAYEAVEVTPLAVDAYHHRALELWTAASVQVLRWSAAVLFVAGGLAGAFNGLRASPETIGSVLRVTVGLAAITVLGFGAWSVLGEGWWVAAVGSVAASLAWVSTHRDGDVRLERSRPVVATLFALAIASVTASEAGTDSWLVLAIGISAGTAVALYAKRSAALGLVSVGIAILANLWALDQTRQQVGHAAVRFGYDVPNAVDLIGEPQYRFERAPPACIRPSGSLDFVDAVDRTKPCRVPAKRRYGYTRPAAPKPEDVVVMQAVEASTSSVELRRIDQNAWVRDPKGHIGYLGNQHAFDRGSVWVVEKREGSYRVEGEGWMSPAELHRRLSTGRSLSGVIVKRHPSISVQDVVAICLSSHRCRLE